MAVDRTGADGGDHDGRGRSMRPTLGLLVLLAAALVLAGCAQQDGGGNGTGDGDGGPYGVSATGARTFDPGTVTVQVGETVRWTVTGDLAHTVTSYSVPDGASSFASGNLDPGDTFEVTFDAAGTYEYRCRYHSSGSGTGFSGMVGTVVVESA